MMDHKMKRDVTSPTIYVSKVLGSNTLNNQYCESLRRREVTCNATDQNSNEFELDANLSAPKYILDA